MMHGLSVQLAIWLLAAASVLAMLARPGNVPEAVWVSLGAVLMVLSTLLPLPAAWAAVASGSDVYLFLAGMMLLAELARREGLFDWVAAYALQHALGSARRLFLLVYAVGTVVTVFLSNDATAVVLTPAVYATARRADSAPQPYLLACAFIANAASFVLPISNPANLVVFADRMPPLVSWLRLFALSSGVAIVVTYLILRTVQRQQLQRSVAPPGALPPLSAGGRIAATTLLVTACAQLAASALGLPLGLVTCSAAVLACLVICILNRELPGPALRGVAWSVLPLVAGLFVLMRAVESTGLLTQLNEWLSAGMRTAPTATAFAAGASAGVLSNLVNNLPMGLLAATLAHAAAADHRLAGALLIGVDLGPNLAVTGSLATLLWLLAIRREGEHVGFRDFLRVGIWVMPVSLTLALLACLAR
jgi:arsenical pump membrane protein